MTAYLRKKFSVGAPGTPEFRDNWEKTFRSGKAPAPSAVPSPSDNPDVLRGLPHDVTRDVQSLFEAAQQVLSVEHPHARTLAGSIRSFAFELAAQAKAGLSTREAP